MASSNDLTGGWAYPVSIADVFQARRRIQRAVRSTPLIESDWLSRTAGMHVSLKLESVQVTCSFKARGALNALLRLRERDPDARVATASAGNHGRAIAWAAEQLGLSATVFTPENAPETKRRAIERHGATLRAETASYEAAEQQAKQWAADTGAVYVSPYSDPDVIAGAGTVGLELLEDADPFDTIVVPVGGGGLISGILTVVKALSPATRVVGVEVEASGAFSAARLAGRIVEVEVGETIADGLGGNVDPDTITWPFLRDLADDVVLVSEETLYAALTGLVAEEHLIAEGAGAAGVAAVLGGRMGDHGARVGVVVSGGNIDAARLAQVIGGRPAHRQG